MDEESAVNMNDFMSVEQNHSISEAENIADFQIKDGVLVAYLGSEENVIIPDSVTEIGMGAFSEKKIKSVVIPDSVTTIGKMAFYCCENLLEVIGANCIEIIDDMAFYDCHEMEYFKFPETLTTIGDNTFAYNSLLEVTFPDSLVEIRSEAFRDSRKLNKLVLNCRNIQILGNKAFADCFLLQQVYISADVKEIKGQCFTNCTALEEIRIIGNVEKICNAAFMECIKLSNVIISDTVKEIESFAFGICLSLEEITLPSTIKEISEGMFFYCSKLCKITIPNTVVKIGENAFFSCSALKSIDLPNNLQIIDRQAFLRSGLEHITIPESVRKIGAFAFYSDESNALKNVTVNSNDIDIEKAAFINAFCIEQIEDMIDHGFDYYQIYNKLRSDHILVVDHSDSRLRTAVTFASAYNTDQKSNEKENVEHDNLEQDNNEGKNTAESKRSKQEETSTEKKTKDKSYSFQVQNGVLIAYHGYDEEIIIPDSVVEIGIGVFSEKEIKTVTIPDSVVTISKMAFYHCSLLEKVIGGNGIEIIEDMAFYDCERLEDFIFSQKLKEIGAGAFSYNVLSEIHFPDSLLKIGDDAFRGSKNLREIDIVGLNSLVFGKRAFSSCKKLTKLNISRSWEIGDYCFENCTCLTEANLTNFMFVIGSGAFSGCKSLKIVKLPCSIRKIGDSAFDSCKQMTEIVLPPFLEELNIATFSDCSSLRKLVLPDNIKKIHALAFDGCSSLENVYFPNGLEVIGSCAFRDCALQCIRIPDTVRKIEMQAFSDSTLETTIPVIVIESDRIEIEPSAFDYYTSYECLELIEKGNSLKHIINELRIKIKVHSGDDKMIEAILLGRSYSTEWKSRKLEIKIFQLLLAASTEEERKNVEKIVEQSFDNSVWEGCKEI